MTLCAFALSALLGAVILGYHPYAEDGGLYLAEIKHLLDRALYPHDTDFVSGHLRLAGFSYAIAAVVRWTGWSLAWVALLLHGFSLCALLAGVAQIASLCFVTKVAQISAVGTVALCLTLPVAGTSLMLMDPYLTARGISTPLTVLGIAALLALSHTPTSRRKRWAWIAWSLLAFATAIAVHPLMAAYGIVEAAMLLCFLSPRRFVQRASIALLVALVLGAAILIQAHAPAETANERFVAATRAYWFLAQWRWFEWVGLAAPLAILVAVSRSPHASNPLRALARMALLAGLMGLLLSILFVREDPPVHAIARMQPLRSFGIVYLVMLIALGAAFGNRILLRSALRWAVAASLLGGIMFAVQRATYPGSDHLELPWTTLRNPWAQAFLWVRQNTTKSAFFALDADYVHLPGEDAQGFRALAERSVLPDYSKDGGAASIRPKLTQAWINGQDAQAGLSSEPDFERLRKLHGTGVSWIILQQGSATAFPCPYRNHVVRVCHLPEP